MGASMGAWLRSYKLLPSFAPNTSVPTEKIDMGSHLMQRLNAFAVHFPFFCYGCKTALSYYPCSRSYITFYIPPSPRGKKERPVWLKSVACVSIFFFIFGTISR